MSINPLFSPFSDRNYLGDSPQNISPKITPQESPPNIYSAGIHQVSSPFRPQCFMSWPLFPVLSSPFRRMSAEPLTSTRRSSNRRHTARSRFFRSHTPSRRSLAMHTLRPLTWPTSNQNPTTPRRSSCPRSCETVYCWKMSCHTASSPNLPICPSRWTTITRCRSWRLPRIIYRYLRRRATKQRTAKRAWNIVWDDITVRIACVAHHRKSISLTGALELLRNRIPDSIGEINDASSRRVEEVLASELRDASRSLHHESFRRQLTHTRVRPPRWLPDASLEILHTNYQRLRIVDGLSILRRRAAIQSQEHLAADWWERARRMFTPQSVALKCANFFRSFSFSSASQRPHSRGERNMECHYTADVRSSGDSSGQLGVQVWLTFPTLCVHFARLSLDSCRRLDPSKIITDDKRLRFSFVGITDIVSFDPNQQNPFQLVNHYQQVSEALDNALETLPIDTFVFSSGWLNRSGSTHCRFGLPVPAVSSPRSDST